MPDLKTPLTVLANHNKASTELIKSTFSKGQYINYININEK